MTNSIHPATGVPDASASVPLPESTNEGSTSSFQGVSIAKDSGSSSGEKIHRFRSDGKPGFETLGADGNWGESNITPANYPSTPLVSSFDNRTVAANIFSMAFKSTESFKNQYEKRTQMLSEDLGVKQNEEEVETLSKTLEIFDTAASWYSTSIFLKAYENLSSDEERSVFLHNLMLNNSIALPYEKMDSFELLKTNIDTVYSSTKIVEDFCINDAAFKKDKDAMPMINKFIAESEAKAGWSAEKVFSKNIEKIKSAAKFVIRLHDQAIRCERLAEDASAMNQKGIEQQYRVASTKAREAMAKFIEFAQQVAVKPSANESPELGKLAKASNSYDMGYAVAKEANQKEVDAFQLQCKILFGSNHTQISAAEKAFDNARKDLWRGVAVKDHELDQLLELKANIGLQLAFDLQVPSADLERPEHQNKIKFLSQAHELMGGASKHMVGALGFRSSSKASAQDNETIKLHKKNSEYFKQAALWTIKEESNVGTKALGYRSAAVCIETALKNSTNESERKLHIEAAEIFANEKKEQGVAFLREKNLSEVLTSIQNLG